MSGMWRLILFLLLVALATPLSAQPLPATLTDGVRFDERLGEQVPLDLRFTDETGKSVKLGDCLQKPTILVLTYYRCASLCTLVHNGLIQSLHELPLEVGRDFNVVMASFDPRETSELAAAKKKVYLAHYGKREAAGGWCCLTGEPEAIGRLSRAVGFRCHYDTEQQEFIHTAGLVILTPDGKISRYFHDILYPPGTLQKSLAEARGGKIGPTTDQPLRYCFHFDPGEGKHTATILTLARVLAVLTIIAVVGLVWYLIRTAGVRRRPSPPERPGDGFLDRSVGDPVASAEQGETR